LLFLVRHFKFIHVTAQLQLSPKFSGSAKFGISNSFSVKSSVSYPSKVSVTIPVSEFGSVGISPMVQHPASAYSNTPPIISNNDGAFLRSIFTNISVALVNSVTKYSQIAYSVGWQRCLVSVRAIDRYRPLSAHFACLA
jgi:hypothetical protein